MFSIVLNSIQKAVKNSGEEDCHRHCQIKSLKIRNIQDMKGTKMKKLV
jgi:hypothetical protein